MAGNSTALVIQLKGDNRDLRRAFADSESRGKSFAKNIGKVVAAGVAAVAAGTVAIGVASVNQASDLQESANAVAVTFGDEAADIAKLAESAAKGVGLSASEFNGFAVQFSSFAETVAGAGGDVSDTVDDISKRAADFASVMNLDVNEAARLFQSGLAGETEPLRKFGIDLSASAVGAHAVATGIADSASEMTEQQKVQARYSLLMEKTAKTQGDFANTSDSLANQQRILGATVKNLGAKIGTALLPVLEKVATVVAEQLVPWLEKNLPAAIDGVKRVIAAVVPIVVGLYAAFKSIYDFFRNNTAVLAGVATLIGGGLLLALGLWTAATYAQVTALYAQAAAFMVAHAPIIAVIAALALLVAGVVYAYQNFEFFRVAVDAVRAWMVDTLWPAIQVVAQGIADAFAALVGFVRKHWNTIRSVIETVIGVIAKIIETTIAVIQTAWETWGDEILAYIKTTFETIRAVIESVIGVIRGIIKTVTALIKGDWQGVWDGIKLTVSSTWDGIKGIVSGALNSVKLALDAAVDGIKLALTKPYTAAKELIVDTVNTIISFIGGMPNRLLNLAGDFLGAGLALGGAILRGIVDGISGAISIVGDIASAVGSAVASAVRTAANSVINGVNRALEFTIHGPGFLPDIHLNPPDIPRFHSGGVVRGPVGREVPIMALPGETVFTEDQMAALGGRGGPLELGDDTIRKLASHMMAAAGVGAARSEAQLLAELRGGVR